MEKIVSRDIHITRHYVDGFTLSYITDDNRYYHHRYIGYGINHAIQLFKQYVYKQMAKEQEITRALGVG